MSISTKWKWGKGVFAVIGSGTPLDKDVSIGKDFLPVANTFWGKNASDKRIGTMA